MVLAFKYGVTASVKCHDSPLARRRVFRLGGVRGALSTPLQSPTCIPRRKRRGPTCQTIELSAKNVQKYEAVLRFYRTARLIDRVIWLVKSPAIRDTVLRAKACIKDDSTNYHLFVDLEDYLKNGWDAAVTNDRSQRLFTLRENYQEICGDLYRELMGNLKGPSLVTVHLANQKVIGKSRA